MPADLDAFAAHLAGSFIPNAVIIDATASEAPAEHYESWMRAGVNVITPNKKVRSLGAIFRVFFQAKMCASTDHYTMGLRRALAPMSSRPIKRCSRGPSWECGMLGKAGRSL